MKVQIFPNAEALSQTAAALFVRLSNDAVDRHGRFTVALSGGTTPKRVHEFLAQGIFRDNIPWEKVHVFWGDERWVPMDDPRSNARMAFDTLLDFVPIPRHQIHPMRKDVSPRTEGSETKDARADTPEVDTPEIYVPNTEAVRAIQSEVVSPEEAAAEYEALLKTYFPDQAPRFDLVFLGLGDDGHTASLFPNTSVLYEEGRWVKEIFVEKVGMDRITLTVPAINWADNVIFLVAGANKAQVVQEVMEGPYQPDRLPAQLIQPANSEIHWLLDEAAAANIKRAEK